MEIRFSSFIPISVTEKPWIRLLDVADGEAVLKKRHLGHIRGEYERRYPKDSAAVTAQRVLEVPAAFEEDFGAPRPTA